MKQSFVILAAMLFSTAFFFGKPSIEFDRLDTISARFPEDSELSCEFVFATREAPRSL
jgi:hypothetical protein